MRTRKNSGARRTETPCPPGLRRPATEGPEVPRLRSARRRAGRRALRPVLLTLAGLLLPGLALAHHPGDLDTRFGTNGQVFTDFGGGAYGGALALGKHGKIYVGGTFDDLRGGGSDLMVARFTAEGRVDTSWRGAANGQIGWTQADVGGEEDGRALVVQKDGRVVIAGGTQAATGPANPALALARFLPDGTLDRSFGVDGTVLTRFNTGFHMIFGLALQGDGKIVAAGDSGGSGVVARYLPNGRLDEGFGQDGRVSAAIGPDGADFYAVTLQSDGKIVVTGDAIDGLNCRFFVARFLKNGQPDTSFGSSSGTPGFALAGFPGNSSGGYAVTVQHDGEIVAAGHTVPGTTSEVAVARFNRDGTLDASFGAGGLVSTPFANNGADARGVGIQDDGKIVTAGNFQDPSGPTGFALARYTKKGQLDASFGNGGTVVTLLNEGSAQAMALAKDHRILVAGTSANSSRSSFGIALARYLGK